MEQTLTVSRAGLTTFQICQRRFQLRYLDRLSWPAVPEDARMEKARIEGERFHQFMHRHFLSLSVSKEAESYPELARWWKIFLSEGPQISDGQHLPELTLTVPMGRHLLSGRFDLLVLSREQVHLFDWKTEARARAEGELVTVLQTRLYLALAAEGAPALDRKFGPEHILMTYWYVNEPAASVTIHYDQAKHVENWKYIGQIVDGINRRLAVEGKWPLTEDLSACEQCAFQVYCGRQTDSFRLSQWESLEDDPILEPDFP
jgi:CRISPR/Cas system-associated exonuclease Cas4 (RecB family)